MSYLTALLDDVNTCFEGKIKENDLSGK